MSKEPNNVKNCSGGVSVNKCRPPAALQPVPSPVAESAPSLSCEAQSPQKGPSALGNAMAQPEQHLDQKPPAPNQTPLMGSLCAQTYSLSIKNLPCTSACYGSGQTWSSVSFEISRKNLKWERIKSISLSPASAKCLTILCNLKASTLTSPVPSATWFILCCLYPGVPAAAKPAANILGISALESQLLCEAAALQFEICVCKGNLSNNNIERGKKEEKGLYITELTELLQ